MKIQRLCWAVAFVLYLGWGAQSAWGYKPRMRATSEEEEEVLEPSSLGVLQSKSSSVSLVDEADELVFIASLAISVCVGMVTGGINRQVANAGARERLAANKKVADIQVKKGKFFVKVSKKFQAAMLPAEAAYKKLAESASRALQLKQSAEWITKDESVKVALARMVLIAHPDLSTPTGRANYLRGGAEHGAVKGAAHDAVESAVHAAAEHVAVELVQEVAGEVAAEALGDVVLPGIGTAISLGKLGGNLIGLSSAKGRTARMVESFPKLSEQTEMSLRFWQCKAANLVLRNAVLLRNFWHSIPKSTRRRNLPPDQTIGSELEEFYKAAKKVYSFDLCPAYRDAKHFKGFPAPPCITKKTGNDECCPITEIWFTTQNERPAEYKYKPGTTIDHVKTIEIVTSGAFTNNAWLHAKAPPCVPGKEGVYYSGLFQITTDSVATPKDLTSNGPFQLEPTYPIVHTKDHHDALKKVPIGDYVDFMANLTHAIGHNNQGVDYSLTNLGFSTTDHIYMAGTKFPGPPLVNLDTGNCRGKHWCRKMYDLDGGEALDFHVRYYPEVDRVDSEATLPPEDNTEALKVVDALRKR